MFRGPDPPYIDDGDFCIEDYKWPAVIVYILLVILAICVIVRM